MSSPPTGPESPTAHLRLGALGEELAAEHLRSDGMRILDRNWSCESGELDIIAGDHGVLVFCEVKTRRHRQWGSPFEAVDAGKVRRLSTTARRWRQRRRLQDRPYRYDLVGILVDGARAELEHRQAVW